MNFRFSTIALGATIAGLFVSGTAGAYQDCPTGVTCTEYKVAAKNGSFFRVNVPENWDGDLVIVNHGFDLNRKHIRMHEVCEHNSAVTCENDTDCGPGGQCNEISYMGVDEILMPLGKAVAASTYSETGWAVFDSAKDLKEILKFVKKEIGKPARVIVTGFSLGGAVTADATLKMKIDGAVPLCGAVGGGLPTWDVAGDVRLVYDFLCDDVPGAAFSSPAGVGEPTTNDSDADALGMALKVNTCFGVLFPSGVPAEADAQAARLADFYSLTQFSGSGIEVAQAMGFATLGMGDFVRDDDRLKGSPIGFNTGLDYSTMGTDMTLAGEYEAAVERLEQGKGRKKLTKASFPDFTKGKGGAVEYPILSMAGAADWLVIPEFQRVYTTALEDGDKLITQTWISTYGHCVFTAEELTAVYNEYFAWIDSADLVAAQPTAQDIEDACLALPTGIDGDTCNFDSGFAPGAIFNRIPPRADWPLAATH